MRLGEKYFDDKEVIRIMTDVENVLYKKKVKVYSETFNEYRWMTKDDIETNYKFLIPLAFMKLYVIEAIPSSSDLDDLFIEMKLNAKSMFVDNVQIEDEYNFGEYNYGSTFTRLNNLIDCTKKLLKENYRILTDSKDKNEKLSLILDEQAEGAEDFYIFQETARLTGDKIVYKDIVTVAVYINDYYDDIFRLLDPKKVKLYDKLISNTFTKIKELTGVDFKINTLRQAMVIYGTIDCIDIRIGVQSFYIKAITPVIKENELNTLYMFDNKSLSDIAVHCFFSRMNDMMILKYWYDINVNSFTYDYRLIRDLTTGWLFVLLCKTDRSSSGSLSNYRIC